MRPDLEPGPTLAEFVIGTSQSDRVRFLCAEGGGEGEDLCVFFSFSPGVGRTTTRHTRLDATAKAGIDPDRKKNS